MRLQSPQHHSDHLPDHLYNQLLLVAAEAWGSCTPLPISVFPRSPPASALPGLAPLREAAAAPAAPSFLLPSLQVTAEIPPEHSLVED